MSARPVPRALFRPEPPPLAAAALAVLLSLVSFPPAGWSAGTEGVAAPRGDVAAPRGDVAAPRGDVAAPQLELVSAGAREGHVQLAWEAHADQHGGRGSDWIFQLQEGARADFSAPLLRYEGPQMACFVSGLPDGTWYWRLRQRPSEDARWSAWSEVVSVEIEHHDLRLAWGLFALGALLVGSILTFLVIAERRVRAEERG